MSITALYQKDKHNTSAEFIFLIIYLLDKKMDDVRMKREEIRRQNARALASRVGGPAEFARKVGMEGAQVTHIIGDKPIRNIGNTVAPRIEDAFELPRGWLDVEHDAMELDSEEIAELVRMYRSLDQHGRATVMTVAKSLAGTSGQVPT